MDFVLRLRSGINLLLSVLSTFQLTFCQSKHKYSSFAYQETSLLEPLSHGTLVRQMTCAIVQNRSFDSQMAIVDIHPWTVGAVCEVLMAIPRFFFQSGRSVGRQHSFRRRAPLRQRDRRQEAEDSTNGVRLRGPAAYRDPSKVNLGLTKALEFYSWVEVECGFSHNEITCKEMACVLAKGNAIKKLWHFLHEMAKREGQLVNTVTLTCIIKILGEEGLVKEALAAFYRMKQFHCKPDVVAYNTIIGALCRVGNFKMARFLLDQMEIPGFRCPPDTFTYTILIGFYCKHSLQTGCRKAIRRRIWEANHLYYSVVNEVEKAIEMMRSMELRRHGTPTSSSFTPIIHALCEARRSTEAQDFLVEMVDRGSIPREYTYKLVCDTLALAGQAGLPHELCQKIEDGISTRYKQVMRVKPVMKYKDVISQ
ncbi:hypothetical protein H6P81_015183 [Aristolochia fimbriata]|uniref:Pentatricopeptide repeat-containing protein n=1 Tax=Aristolochia fimbriata TaxID=158543 RepID=A0AAV7E4S5_ARIFI|nr:hypothetical protein H6P81_015183 [Aristolochia fimbriata]